ncbi:MAG: alpha/beta hydrolase [Betaproteobacteria bacterium]|nr:alpha/beta hydrolase [Betaproteobacteria bacterium]
MTAARYHPDVKSITLASGLTLPYVESGARDGEPVIFLHGYTDAWPSWQRVLAHLPTTLRAFAISQRGHGHADKPATGYAPVNMAEDLADFMNALRIDRAIIVGHSMGSVIAQHFAERHADRVTGMVLVGALRGYGGNPAIEELGEFIASLTEAPDEGFIREFQRSTLAQPVPAAFFEAMVAESLQVPLHVWRAGMTEFLAAKPATRFDAPTLTIWGDQDSISPHADQMALMRLLPDVRLIVYRGQGHAPHWESPDRFADDVAAFCNECARLARRARHFDKEAA